MAQTVIGIFDNATEAKEAVEALVAKGFDRSMVDLSATGGTSTASGTGNTGYSTSSSHAIDEGESKVGKFFKSLFGGDDDTDNTYSSYSKAAEGRSLVTVHARSEDEAEDAADILDDYGAINTSDNNTSYNATGSTNTVSDASQTGTGETISVIEEQLSVGKKTVETGGVRLRSRIVERPVEESLRLREERVFVDRTTVNRPVSASELENFREGTIELTETAEVPVVAKEAYVKEEIRVGKEVSERDETIRDTVRSTEVEVENLKSDRSDNTTTSNSGTGSL